MLVLQASNAGVRRPGCEASIYVCSLDSTVKVLLKLNVYTAAAKLHANINGRRLQVGSNDECILYV